MLYGQIGTFEDAGESWTIIFCKQQNRVEHRFYIIEDVSTIFHIRFFDPCFRTFPTFIKSIIM